MSFHEGMKLNRLLLIVTDIDNKQVIVNLKESPLRWLASFKEKNGQYFLDDSELQAGEKFRRDCFYAGLNASLTVNLDAVKVDNTYNANYTSEAKLDAAHRLNNAQKELGATLYALMQDFLGFEMQLEACEQKRGWPRRSGKIVVKLALSQLAKHYGFKVE